MNDPATPVDDERTIGFLSRQMEQYGGTLEIEPNVWALFVVAASDSAENALAQELLASATFACQVHESDDDLWAVYCVTGDNRAAAAFWINDMHRKLSGQIRCLSPSQLSLLDDIRTSPMPHRVARSLADLHSKGEITAGAVRRPNTVRGLLDRLHTLEPLYFSAFQSLLEHHLIDLIVLNQKLEAEDVRLENDLIRGSLSKDPFFQARQAAAAQIRNHLIRYHLINSIDQLKGTAANNPYVSITDIRFIGDDVMMRIDGIDKPASRPDFLSAIRMLRKSLYRGNRVEEINSQAPWMTEVTVYPLRFIRQQMSLNREISSLDWLYMLERAVDPLGQP